MSQQEKDKPGYCEVTDLVKKTCQEMNRNFAVWAALKADGRLGRGLL